MRVLIGPMSSPAGKLGIERLLKWAPPGTVNTNIVALLDSWPLVLAAIARGAADPAARHDVLIAEFRLHDSPSFAALNSLDPGLSVIDLDLERGTGNTPMFDLGSHRLRRLVEWLAEEAGLTLTGCSGAGPDQPPLEAAQAAPAQPLALPPAAATPEPPAEAFSPASAPPLRAVPAPAPRAGREAQLAELAEWLELRLALTLARLDEDVARRDYPGWSMSAARARTLLGADTATLSAAELSKCWAEADARLEACIEAAAQAPPDNSVGWISHAFALDKVARQMLWLTAAPALSGNFAEAMAFLNDDLAQRRPTPSLLSRLIDDAGPPWEVQRRLSGHDALARLRLVEARADPATPESLAPLFVAADVAAMLLGGAPGAAVDGATLYDPADHDGETFDLQVAPVLRAARAASRDSTARPVVHLQAPTAEAGWLAAQLASVGEMTLVGDLSKAAGADYSDLYGRLLAFARSARAVDGVLVVAGLDSIDSARRTDLSEALVAEIAPWLRLVAVQGTRIAPTALRKAAGGVIEISRSRPTREERVWIWTRAAAARGFELPEKAARDLAATFAFDAEQSEAAIALARGGGPVEEVNAESLRDAARLVSRASAPPAVRRIETNLGWDDLILPAAVKAELRSIPLQVRHGATVWERWGFGDRIPYGQAMIALLAGPSGTGKTMAAQIIAAELGVALFQVDLAKTVSKYIGETERVLDDIFAACDGPLLLFDEADALFGKRSEIHDAHDRYANIEVNYLLQRVEEHAGPVLLTTNRKGNLDPAFLRRLNKIVDFPLPDEAERAQIWKRMVPAEAPVAPDVDTSVFSQLPLSGGAIVNAVLTAAFIGAEDGGVIRMSHLVAGARSELAKCGMESAGRGLTHLIDHARAGMSEP